MTSPAGNRCPLCSEVFPAEQLHAHILSEHPRLRHSTIQVIQAYHPAWREDQGACGPCWRSYREAGRILSVLREGKRRGSDWYLSPDKPEPEFHEAEPGRTSGGH